MERSRHRRISPPRTDPGEMPSLAAAATEKTEPTKPMKKTNYISASMTEAEIEATVTSLRAVEAQLTFLQDIDPQLRKRLQPAGDKSIAFVRKALDVANASPEMLPRDFELEEFQKDVRLSDALDRILVEILRLGERVRATQLVARADAYACALEVYNRTQRTRHEGRSELADQMGRRFKRKPADDESTDATSAT